MSSISIGEREREKEEKRQRLIQGRVRENPRVAARRCTGRARGAAPGRRVQVRVSLKSAAERGCGCRPLAI